MNDIEHKAFQKRVQRLVQNIHPFFVNEELRTIAAALGELIKPSPRLEAALMLALRTSDDKPSADYMRPIPRSDVLPPSVELLKQIGDKTS